MRKFLLLAAALILAAFPGVPAAAAPVDDAPTTTPIEHVVWMMQDNHSFDNYFGAYPGADGIPSGVCQRLNLNRESTRGCVQPFHIGETPVEDLSQGPGVQRRQHNDGRMDGFVAAYRRLGLDGTSAMGYYDGSDIPFHWNVADQYVLFDRFFSSTKVGSREAYLYWVAGKAPAGQTPLRSNAGYDDLPTIFDRLSERNISARFYVENLDAAATRGGSVARSSQLIKVPLLSMKRFRDGGDLAGQVVDLSQYYLDLRNGTLPAVSYIVTTRSSENPPADPSAGSRTLRKVTTELMKSSSWSTSALMWTYDGWGGWYDHVPPPSVDSRGYGFRVPALLVSPYARKGEVNHTVLDYTSMLHFIETNWKLAPLSTRDKQSAGLASAFDFTAAPRPANSLPWTWPAMEVRAAADSPAPVIYSVYGLAVALAIAILALAARRGPIPVTVAGAAVLIRSSFESVRGRMERLLPVRRLSTSPSASPATRLPEQTPERPARSSAAAIPNQKRADDSEAIPEPYAGRGQASIRESRADATVETDAQADAETQTDLEANAESLTEGPVTPGAGLTPVDPMTDCSEPGCTGVIVDDYCDVCGSPASAPDSVPAGAAASTAAPAPAAHSAPTPVPRVADAESATDAVPATTGDAAQSATETAPPTTAEGEDPTTVAAAATNAAPMLDQGSRHQRRPLSRTQRRKVGRR
jgi:phospholipase C